MTRTRSGTLMVSLLVGAVRCGDEGMMAVPLPTTCQVMGSEAPDMLRKVGCKADFDLLASQPLDTAIPGARSVKFVIDQHDADNLYFQNSKKYKVHFDFVSRHLGGMGRPVGSLSDFNMVQYYSPSRRFLLGSVTYYEGPKVWTVEFAPYDTASTTMIAKAYQAIATSTFFGATLYFHPTSQTIERESAKLPSSVKLKTTRDLFEGIDFQPLNLGTTVGRLRFLTAQQLEMQEYLAFRDIVVLDRVPNDLSVTLGIITDQFQTPLAHINVLAQTRKIPNMGLRNAFMNPQLRALENKWVKFTVNVEGFTVEEVTLAAADAWWEMNKPPKANIAKADTSVMGLWDVTKILDATMPLRERVRAVIPRFGGKASHYAAMAQNKVVPMWDPPGFAIPSYYYFQFLQRHGLDKKVEAMIADPTFRSDPRVRDARLKELRDAIEAAPFDAALDALITAKLAAEYPGRVMRFRSSATAEDLEGFSGAGLYTSKSGEPDNANKTNARAIKEVWASTWRLRAYEEREYRSVEHLNVAMAILCHPAFRGEHASGVAVTANPNDPSGLQPGFLINVQLGDGSVVLPEAGIKADQLVYLYDFPGQPIQYLDHSNLVATGQTVLTRTQVNELGMALDAIHQFFRPAYGTVPGAWYGMDVEFKFHGTPPRVYIKQARPYPTPGGR
jgi:pyruvate,water dikinase